MNVWLLLIGAGLITVTLVDALWTTIIPHGAGLLTASVCRLLWTTAKRSPGLVRRRLLPTMGSVCLLTVLASWVAGLWLGWYALFLADSASVVHGPSGLEADTAARFYFVGFTVFTLGVGDYVPAGTLWQVATPLASFSGLFLITLAVTYLLPVLSAATQKRQLAAMISDLGTTPSRLLVSHWNEGDFNSLTQRLDAIWPMLHLHAQRHLAYPILHYFHSAGSHRSLAVNVAALDEALTILACGVLEDARPRASTITPVRRAIADLLKILDTRFVRVSDRTPPEPDLTLMASAGVPVVSTESFSDQVSALGERRRRLRAFVEDAGWSWHDVLADDPNQRPIEDGPA